MRPVRVKLKGPSVRQHIRREMKKKSLTQIHQETGIPLGSLYRLRDDGESAFISMDYMQALYENLTKNRIRLK